MAIENYGPAGETLPDIDQCNRCGHALESHNKPLNGGDLCWCGCTAAVEWREYLASFNMPPGQARPRTSPASGSPS